jgi:hypothetical protein
MRKDLPVYEILIDLENPDTMWSFNSIVSNPAHGKPIHTFSKVQRYEFNDEKQIVTGVIISSDTEIYRNHQGKEFYVKFKKQGISDMILYYSKNQLFNKLSFEHDPSQVIEDAYLTMLYQIDNKNGFTAPERFKDETDGTLIGSYKIQNKEIYDKFKSGEYGFSIEGDFIIEEMFKSMGHEAENEFLTQVIEDLKSMLK